MIERAKRARFLLEPQKPFRIMTVRGGQQLDGHVAMESIISCAIDLAHATCAEKRNHFVRAESGACSNRHEGAAADYRR